MGSFGNSVRVLSLDPKTLYVELTTQMLPNMVADVMLVSPRSLSTCAGGNKNDYRPGVGERALRASAPAR